MLQNFSQTQGTVFHSSACISSSEGFLKNRSAHFCGKSPSSGACPSQIAILFIPGAEISHEVKTDLHLWRPEFLRLPAGFRKPFQLTETRRFADHFLKISRSYSSGNLNYSNFPRAEQSGQLWCLAPYQSCQWKEYPDFLAIVQCNNISIMHDYQVWGFVLTSASTHAERVSL